MHSQSGTDICSNGKVNLSQIPAYTSFPQSQIRLTMLFANGHFQMSSRSPRPKRCVWGLTQTEAKPSLGKSFAGVESQSSRGSRFSASAPRGAALRTPPEQPQRAVPGGAEERGARGAYLRLGPASALPAPAVGGQHGPWAPGRARRPPPPAAWPAPSGPALSHLRVWARGRAARCLQRRRCGEARGAGRAGRTGRSWPPPGAALADQRRAGSGVESEGQLRGPGGCRVRTRAPRDPGKVPRRGHLLDLWPSGRGRQVGVLLAVPSHKATVEIQAACRSRFPSGPRAQNLGCEWG